MSTVKHVKLASYIKLHQKNWDLDVKVVTLPDLVLVLSPLGSCCLPVTRI
jgi:hypothetical protein